MRERGFEIEVSSVNPPDRSAKDLPPVEATEANRTFYVKAGGSIALFWKVLAVALLHPVVLLRGTAAALRLGGLDLRLKAYAFFYLAEALLVGKWLRRNSLPHLHVHFGGPVATVGMLTSIAWRVPWSLTLHGPDEFFDQEAFYLRQKIESASFVVCISDFCRSQVLRICPHLPASRVEVVRLGVDCTALRPKTPETRLDSAQVPANPARLVCTGRMVAAKGHRILIEALAAVSAAGIKFDCTLVGDGPERRSLEALCAKLGIAPQVHFLGALSHPETLAQVAQAEVFVLASFAEGLPVALMEAMALGVPCVSTTIAAIPELIRSGENGLLVAPANVEELSHALMTLINNAELRRQLGLNARRTVEAGYDLARNLDLLAEKLSQRLAANPWNSPPSSVS